jgi:DNA-binding response OmpR family regulator
MSVAHQVSISQLVTAKGGETRCEETVLDLATVCYLGGCVSSELFVCRFGVFELVLRAAELRKNGVKLRLQDQPYQILLKLIEHSGEIVGREELRSTLWHEDTFVDVETG